MIPNTANVRSVLRQLPLIISIYLLQPFPQNAPHSAGSKSRQAATAGKGERAPRPRAGEQSYLGEPTTPTFTLNTIPLRILCSH
jgi:hypothetical protein